MPLGFNKATRRAAANSAASGGIGLGLLDEGGGGAVDASGGTESTITVDGQDYRLHTFTSSGTFTVDSGGFVDVLIVGGGGGAYNVQSYSSGGTGGGGGGVVDTLGDIPVEVTAQSYTITVGAAGTSGAYTASNGGNSSAFSITAGGGLRGTSANGGRSGTPQSNNGSNGSNYSNSSYDGHGCGGGAGGAASPSFVEWNATSASGGPGLQSSITGTSTYYSAGGKGLKAQAGSTSMSNGTGWSSNGYGHGCQGGNAYNVNGITRPGVVYIRYAI